MKKNKEAKSKKIDITMSDKHLSPAWALCASSALDGSSVQVGKSPLFPRKRMGDLCNTAFSS